MQADRIPAAPGRRQGSPVPFPGVVGHPVQPALSLVGAHPGGQGGSVRRTRRQLRPYRHGGARHPDVADLVGDGHVVVADEERNAVSPRLERERGHCRAGQVERGKAGRRGRTQAEHGGAHLVGLAAGIAHQPSCADQHGEHGVAAGFVHVELARDLGQGEAAARVGGEYLEQIDDPAGLRGRSRRHRLYGRILRPLQRYIRP